MHWGLSLGAHWDANKQSTTMTLTQAIKTSNKKKKKKINIHKWNVVSVRNGDQRRNSVNYECSQIDDIITLPLFKRKTHWMQWVWQYKQGNNPHECKLTIYPDRVTNKPGKY